MALSPGPSASSPTSTSTLPVCSNGGREECPIRSGRCPMPSGSPIGRSTTSLATTRAKSTTTAPAPSVATAPGSRAATRTSRTSTPSGRRLMPPSPSSNRRARTRRWWPSWPTGWSGGASPAGASPTTSRPPATWSARSSPMPRSRTTSTPPPPCRAGTTSSWPGRWTTWPTTSTTSAAGRACSTSWTTAAQRPPPTASPS